ncbi:MAG TPA: hypothetical protein PLC54_00860 [Spirochaetales bacterium]|nr:hypothetical protein [Spirochaetales bacterium]
MRTVLNIMAIAVLAVSCVSSPSGGKTPGWVLQTPAPDGTYTYFVGSSSDASGNAVTAGNDAASSLVSEITRFMGVRVTAQTSGVAKGSLDEYSAQVTSTVTQTGSSRLSGFKVLERYQVKQPDGTLAVYILASYVTADLNKEKARISALFQEQQDAVAKPEAYGDASASAGRYFDAVKSYIEAAVAASGSDIENAQIKMERNVNKARAVLGKIRFVRVDAPTTAGLGKEYAKPFSARLVYGEGDGAPGIPSAEVYAVYQRRQSSGRVVTKTERLMTDAKGLVSFTPPPADFVGKASFVFTINLDSARELLDRMPTSYESYVDAIQEDLSRRSLSFEYLVASDAKTVPMGIAVLDLGPDSKALSSSDAQSGLLSTFAKEKFKVGLAPIDAATLASMDDGKILAAAKALYASGLTRFVYGVARISEVRKDGSMWQASAVMTVRCVDLATGIILYSAEKTSIAVGTDEASARRAAMTQVARDVVAKDMMANLP